MYDLMSVICWQGKEIVTHISFVQSLIPYTLNPKTLNLKDRR